MTILITGSTGFVGSALVSHLLAKGHELYHPNHSQLDLTNYYEVKAYFRFHKDIDTVVHCAISLPYRWENRKNDEEWGRKINGDIAMVSNLLRFAPKAIILTSGSAKKFPYSDVGWPKHIISLLCSQSPNVLELRPFGIYGPGEAKDRFPSYCFNQIVHNEPIYIVKNRKMSWIYIDDLCQIIEWFIENRWVHNQMDVVMPEAKSMIQIAWDCMRVAKIDVDIVHIGTGLDYIGDATALSIEMPELNFTSWEDGLRRLYEINHSL